MPLLGVSAVVYRQRLLRCAAVAAIILSCHSAKAAITLDATSTQTGTAGSTSLNWSHALGNGGNRMVVCTVAFGYNDTAISSPIAPSMTFNGVAMTASAQAPTHAQSSTAKIFSQIFYISDTTLGTPAAGTYPVALSIPIAVTGGVAAGCTSVFGALQSGPEATGTSYSGSSTPVPSVTLNTITANDWVIDAYGGGYGSSATASANSGQTPLYAVQNASGNKTIAGSNGSTLR